MLISDEQDMKADHRLPVQHGKERMAMSIADAVMQSSFVRGDIYNSPVKILVVMGSNYSYVSSALVNNLSINRKQLHQKKWKIKRKRKIVSIRIIEKLGREHGLAQKDGLGSCMVCLKFRRMHLSSFGFD